MDVLVHNLLLQGSERFFTNKEEEVTCERKLSHFMCKVKDQENIGRGQIG